MSAARADLDPALQRFLTESPLDRPAIFAFIERLARDLPPDSRVLDAGAGDAPYRELFGHCRYVTSDWSNSPHAGARSADVIAPLHELPLKSGSFDVVVNTQVLEHVADPMAVLQELRRLLVPGGELWLTAPFVWELHEEPYDYFRYTRHGLQSLIERAGFGTIEMHPVGGYFGTMAQLLRNCGSITGLDHAGLPLRAAAALMARAAPVLRRLDSFDARQVLPLGYCCRAHRLEEPGE